MPSGWRVLLIQAFDYRVTKVVRRDTALNSMDSAVIQTLCLSVFVARFLKYNCYIYVPKTFCI